MYQSDHAPRKTPQNRRFCVLLTYKKCAKIIEKKSLNFKVRLFYKVLFTTEWYRPRQLFGRTFTIHPEMVGGACSITGKVIIFTFGLSPSQDEHVHLVMVRAQM